MELAKCASTDAWYAELYLAHCAFPAESAELFQITALQYGTSTELPLCWSRRTRYATATQRDTRVALLFGEPVSTEVNLNGRIVEP